MGSCMAHKNVQLMAHIDMSKCIYLIMESLVIMFRLGHYCIKDQSLDLWRSYQRIQVNTHC